MSEKIKFFQKRNVFSSFYHDFSFDEKFSTLFEKIKQIMNLNAFENLIFSKNIFRVEISNSIQFQLIVVNLLDFIHFENKKQNVRDVNLIHKFVKFYMNNEKNIILIVIFVMNEFANQIVFKKIRDVDSEKKRIIDIITKSNILRIDTNSKKTNLIFVRNENVKFKRDWHVVKNFDFEIDERKIKNKNNEKSFFFEKNNFKFFSFFNVEISNLRYRFNQVFFDQIRFELFKFIENIRFDIITTRNEFEKFDSNRVTFEKQKVFLIKINQKFQIFSKNVINDQYNNSFFKNHLSIKKRFCVVIVNFHDNFEISFRENETRWIVSKNKNKKSMRNDNNNKYRIRKKTIDKIQKLLRINREKKIIVYLTLRIAFDE